MALMDERLAAELTVSEVAEQAGVAPSAVRFYDKHGIIHATRNEGNQRRFTADAICRISAAKAAQRAGLTVREIAELLGDLPPNATCKDWTRVSEQIIAETEARVAELKALLALLGSGDVKLCELNSVLGD